MNQDPRQGFVKIWADGWLQRTGYKLPNSDWGKIKNILYKKFEYPDQKTGEIMVCYPELEEWEWRVTEWFKRNDEWVKRVNWSFVAFISDKVYLGLNPPPKQKRRKKYCTECCSEHYTDEPHKEVKAASQEIIREAFDSINTLMVKAKI